MHKTSQISAASAGFVFAIGSAALFAVRPIFVKLVYAQGIDSTTLIAFRMLFSMPIYAIMLIWLLRDPAKKSKLTLKAIASSSTIGLFGYYSASFLDLIGLQYVTAQFGRMVLYVYPTLVVILGVLFFGERVTLRMLVSLAITYIGIAVIFGHDLQQFGDNVIVGALFIVGSALSFAIYLIFSKSLITELGSRVFTCIALISASIGIFIHYAFTRSILTAQVNAIGLSWIFVIAIFCTVIPTFFTTAAVARIGANKTGIAAMVGPAFTSSFAVLILGEEFTIYHAVGIVMVVMGVWYLHREKMAH
ncbi:MAG: drug/metabolite transporter (DMT)-like permease [Polaribacter sp.]|jgi:drug/metabolite transporter (DMT)-like permease